MLRPLFGEPRTEVDGFVLETNEAIRAFAGRLRHTYGTGKVEEKWIRLDLWASGMLAALDELEQSVYGSVKFGAHIRSEFEDELSESERDDYYRHVYFYKNAFIRVFSILDKTGFFMDTLFALETDKVKQRFSYFTVLRQMHKHRLHAHLEQQLFDLKVKYRAPLDRLRKKRNLEIHSMNAELIDDFWRAQSRFADRMRIEPIAGNIGDLRMSFEMVCRSLRLIFQYSKGLVK